jgi:hypothetical protein
MQCNGWGKTTRERRGGWRGLLEWNGGPPRLHQARGSITLIDEDTPRSGSACADTTTNDARHSSNRQGLRACSRSVVFRLWDEHAQIIGRLGLDQAPGTMGMLGQPSLEEPLRAMGTVLLSRDGKETARTLPRWAQTRMSMTNHGDIKSSNRRA